MLTLQPEFVLVAHDQFIVLRVLNTHPIRRYRVKNTSKTVDMADPFCLGGCQRKVPILFLDYQSCVPSTAP